MTKVHYSPNNKSGNELEFYGLLWKPHLQYVSTATVRFHKKSLHLPRFNRGFFVCLFGKGAYHAILPSSTFRGIKTAFSRHKKPTQNEWFVLGWDWCAVTDSNRWLSPRQEDTLPAELTAHIQFLYSRPYDTTDHSLALVRFAFANLRTLLTFSTSRRHSTSWVNSAFSNDAYYITICAKKKQAFIFPFPEKLFLSAVKTLSFRPR